jgi:GxxExxY protein
VPYKRIYIPGQRLDLLVEEKLIVEVKAVNAIAPIYQAKLLSYLKSERLRAGLIINFNVILLKSGLRRIVR